MENDKISKVILQISLRTLMNVVLLFILVEGFVYTYQFSYKVFADVPYMPASSDTVTITIESGNTAKQVADIMEGSGLVEDDKLILARLYLGKYNKKIIAGTYTLSPAMSADAICKKICGIQSEETL
ncbi:MAG: hypothetical protein MR029_07575 [Clostridium sp.]|nr:hypothetical protein [Clostridium sp.]